MRMNALGLEHGRRVKTPELRRNWTQHGKSGRREWFEGTWRSVSRV